jgi:hypothetical protein
LDLVSSSIAVNIDLLRAARLTGFCGINLGRMVSVSISIIGFVPVFDPFLLGVNLIVVL